jgi:hypothetical protein
MPGKIWQYNCEKFCQNKRIPGANSKGARNNRGKASCDSLEQL